ncbi:hypothetical protein BEN71_12625 [Acinetobacter wuhouensis]|uniref:Uncharacterized protein n=1 Tax=Acinetobacter wuhouensis TaxID=1879050 RepID=A0A385C562_9GAMM|nr:hypothetical protein [Acinetobacter wuhouensis]AXQ22867.1 hypothetical protein BEN71_12625 [Acinetobacter wuhouensis]RZG49288.1 hypothetical protein EXU28_00365 [Acinetobacter wuhouensis]RZG75196.1 hypothetical protein EXU29_02380 [Acinetobacter wuhouensis]
MFDIFFTGVLGALIFGYKFKNETYFKNFLKGVFIGFLGFLIRFIPDYFKGEMMTISDNFFALFLCLSIGAFLGLVFMIFFGIRNSKF